jgi:regulator of sigma D
MLRENSIIQDDPENKKKIAKIYTDQIESLTQKLMDYKRRLRNYEKEKESVKNSEIVSDNIVQEHQ